MKKYKKTPARQDLVIGRNTVREVLRYNPKRVKKLLIAKSSGNTAGSDHRVTEIIALAESAGIPVQKLTQDELATLVQSTSHQSVALELNDRDFSSLSDIVQQTKSATSSIILALDGIEDPHNFGALLRAAECFGVDAVLWSKNRGVQITPAVTKVSVGASELLRLVPVSNLAQALEKCKAAGFWTVVAMLGAGAESLDTFTWPDKTVLVVGAEGEGVRDRTAKEADFRVYIPLSGRVESLNVSQAGALLLHSCVTANRRGQTA
jgi:23S rRNA (guanosine2251-2'-O)-methyltransferase